MTLLGYEELVVQKRELEKRKLALEKYRLELMRIQSSINAILYRANSIGALDYELQEMAALKAQKELTLAALKQDYQLVPHLIPGQIKECNHHISMLRVQLERMGQQQGQMELGKELSRQQQQDNYDSFYEEAKGYCTQTREKDQEGRER